MVARLARAEGGLGIVGAFVDGWMPLRRGHWPRDGGNPLADESPVGAMIAYSSSSNLSAFSPRIIT